MTLLSNGALLIDLRRGLEGFARQVQLDPPAIRRAPPDGEVAGVLVAKAVTPSEPRLSAAARTP